MIPVQDCLVTQTERENKLLSKTSDAFSASTGLQVSTCPQMKPSALPGASLQSSNLLFLGLCQEGGAVMEERGHQYTCTLYYFNNVYKPPPCMSDQHYTVSKIVGLFVRGLTYPWERKIESEFSRLIVITNNISG